MLILLGEVNLPTFVSTHNIAESKSQCCSVPHSRTSMLIKDSEHKGSPISGCLFHLCIFLPLLSNPLLPNICAPVRWTRLGKRSALRLTQKKPGQLSAFQLTTWLCKTLTWHKGRWRETGQQSLCGSAALCYLQIFLELPCWYSAFTEVYASYIF